MAKLESVAGWSIWPNYRGESGRCAASAVFVTDPTQIQILLTEEVGEISSELKRLWSVNYDTFDRTRLANEIADVFVLLAALASEFEIDIAEAVESKFFAKDAQRSWKSAG
ncbi:MAG: hypothetical protein HC802_03415 [Caldilineaceae bacterium]|nr:hypothetical protein [Caldilineaceae bacterium]